MSGEKPKMATKRDTPPGLELDEHGNAIPFEKRTTGDRQKVRDNIAAALHGQQSIKNPENEAETPAPMPPGLAGSHRTPTHPPNPVGQQGGTKGGGKG